MALSSADYDHRLLSPVCEVLWHGWSATTVALQQAGWQMAVERFTYEDSTRIMLHHRERGVYMETGPVRIRDIENASLRRGGPPPRFYVRHVGFDYQVTIHERPLDSFVAVDMHPQYATEPIRAFDVEAFFATPMVRTEEIIVAPQDVSQMLDQIRRMQSPAMAEIRQRERLREQREAGPREVFHAQILSFAK